MLDIKLIRSNPKKVKEALKKRKEKINLDEILKLDQKRRGLLLEADALKETRNTVSEEIGKLKREKKDAREKILAMKEVSTKIKELDARIKEIEEKTDKILLEIPNIPHESVPVGKDEKDNTEIKKWGEPRKFDFTPLPHWDIGEALNILDFERGAKVASARFTVLKGMGAKLEREKIKVAQLMAENYLGDQLSDEENDIFWYLNDMIVFIPDDNETTKLSFRLSGTPVITDRINSSLFRGQIRSIILAFLMVFTMLVIQFKSVKVGLYSIIPLVLTIITAGGAMGVFNIPLNVSTMMVASIAIGAGIDYTIHFISRYKNELKRKGKIDALKTTLTGTGRAIVFNSISIAAGVFVLSFSNIKMMASFGQLIGSVMIVSVIYTLLLLPILLDKVDFKIKKESK